MRSSAIGSAELPPVLCLSKSLQGVACGPVRALLVLSPLTLLNWLPAQICNKHLVLDISKILLTAAHGAIDQVLASHVDDHLLRIFLFGASNTVFVLKEVRLFGLEEVSEVNAEVETVIMELFLVVIVDAIIILELTRRESGLLATLEQFAVLGQWPEAAILPELLRRFVSAVLNL